MRSQRGAEVCRALGVARGSKKHLRETVGPRLRPGCRRQRLRLESTSHPSPEAALLPTSRAAAPPSIPTKHVNGREQVPVARFN